MKRVISVLLTFFMLLTIMPLGTVVTNAAYENTYVNTGDQRVDIIGVAKTQIGYTEGSNNSNKYGAAFNHNNVPWCAYFISWCAKEAGISDSIINRQGVASPFAGYFNIPNTHTEGDYFPKPGDLVFYGPNSKGDHYHVGLVETVDKSTGNITTIEGNTNSSGSSEGHIVYRHTRHYQHNSICCYGTPNYTDPIPHTCNKGVYVYYEAAHPHYNCYKCSICGKVNRNTKETNQIKTCSSCWYTTFDLSDSSVSLKVGESKTISATINGFWPDTRVAASDFDTSIISVTVGKDSLTFKGLKAGSCNFKLIVYSDSTKSHIIGSKTISVTVTKDEYTLSVYYNANGGSISSDIYEITNGLIYKISDGTKAKQKWTYNNKRDNGLINAETFGISKKGHTFIGWGTTSSGETIFDPKNSDLLPTDINSNIKNGDCSKTLYAIWKPNTYVIAFNANGGTGAPESQMKTYGKTLFLSRTVPEREGYEFLGWSTDSKESSATYLAGGSFNTNAKTTLYAIWKEIDADKPKVSIASTNNVASSQTATLNMSDNVGVVSYYWGKNSNPDDSMFESIKSSISTAVEKTVTESGSHYLIARDATGNQGTTKYAFSKVILDANGGVVDIGDIIACRGSGVVLPTPVRNGFLFVGWSMDSNSASAECKPGEVFSVSEQETNLYAVWDCLETVEPVTGTSTATDPTEPSEEVAKPTIGTNPTEPTAETDPTEETAEPGTEPITATDPAESAVPSESTVSSESIVPDKPSDSTEPSTSITEDPSEPTIPVENEGFIGDANGDGKVNVKDATAIQKHIASIAVLSEAGIVLADATGDGKVNVKDATAVQKYVAGIETGLPIGKPKTI